MQPNARFVASRFSVACVAVLLLASRSTSAQETVRVPFTPGPDFVGWVDDAFVLVVTPGERANLRVGRAADGRPQLNVPALQRIVQERDVQGFAREFSAARTPAAGSRRPDLTGHYVVRVASAELEAAMVAFAAAPQVEHVERIGIHRLHATPNDPYYQDSPNPNFNYDQWHYWNAHSVHADQAWDTQTGDASVVVGILDSGVRYFHVDLGGPSAPWGPAAPFAGGNIFINPNETPGNGVDDDGNGFVDDVIGWDFVVQGGGGGVTCLDVDCSGVDNDPDDGFGHGTHVAGTVSAITNNGSTVSGVAGGWGDGTAGGPATGVKLLPLRIGYRARVQGLETGVVRMDWAAQAMSYVADLVDAGVNIVAVNCSWGSSDSGGFGAAVNDLMAHDVMVVHSAGNSNSSTADYLGSRTDVLNVAATDQAGNGASFTNYGPWVDVAAPGVSILSTYSNPADADLTHNYIALMDGTSMSSPHITGIAALLESCNPALTGPQKFSLIVGHTDPYTDVRALGSGIANAAEAIAAANCVCEPAAPIADFSAAPVAGYPPLQVTFSDASTATSTSWSWTFGDGGTSTEQSPTHNYTVTGTYDVRLIAANACGADTLLRPGYVLVTTNTSDAPFATRAGVATFAAPNPCGPSTQIFFRLDRDARIELQLFDVAGRPVRHLAAATYPAGAHALAFDGTDDRGQRLPAGLYVYRLTAGDRVETRKLVVSR